ncbi:MAG: hypothetical protein LBM27_00205 [Lactobacillaceae bacterium]|jgi:preprotein translocase subunit SecE|nr:hypothetical protein [Lactobacillaceae bacterium]
MQEDQELIIPRDNYQPLLTLISVIAAVLLYIFVPVDNNFPARLLLPGLSIILGISYALPPKNTVIITPTHLTIYCKVFFKHEFKVSEIKAWSSDVVYSRSSRTYYNFAIGLEDHDGNTKTNYWVEFNHLDIDDTDFERLIKYFENHLGKETKDRTWENDSNLWNKVKVVGFIVFIIVLLLYVASSIFGWHLFDTVRNFIEELLWSIGIYPNF